MRKISTLLNGEIAMAALHPGKIRNIKNNMAKNPFKFFLVVGETGPFDFRY